MPTLVKDLGMVDYGKYKKRRCLLLCECGNTYETNTQHFIRGASKSCGCSKGEAHGESNSKLYYVWINIKSRCYNKRDPRYDDWGGRGIKMHEPWKNSYLEFKQWANRHNYSDNLSIDRRENEDGYYPDNCRWVTNDIQTSNTRMRKDNTSGYRGVNFHKGNSKWSVSIQAQNKRINLGYFENPKDGAMARNKYIVENKLPHTLCEVKENE